MKLGSVSKQHNYKVNATLTEQTANILIIHSTYTRSRIRTNISTSPLVQLDVQRHLQSMVSDKLLHSRSKPHITSQGTYRIIDMTINAAGKLNVASLSSLVHIHQVMQHILCLCSSICWNCVIDQYKCCTHYQSYCLC